MNERALGLRDRDNKERRRHEEQGGLNERARGLRDRDSRDRREQGQRDVGGAGEGGYLEHSRRG